MARQGDNGSNTDNQILRDMLFRVRDSLPSNLSYINADKGFAERVILAVTSTGKWQCPADIDLQGLANQIWFLREEYPRWVKSDSDSEAKKRHGRLIRLVKALEEVQALYGKDNRWIEDRLTIGQRGDFNFIRALEKNKISSDDCGLRELQLALSLLENRIRSLVHWNESTGFDRKAEEPLLHFTPTRLLVVKIERLADKYIGMKARISRNPLGQGQQGPGGPFIRFAMAVIAEIGADLSAESVAKALLQNRRREARKRRAQ